MKPRNPLELDLVCARCGWRGSSIAPSGSGRPTLAHRSAVGVRHSPAGEGPRTT